MADEWLSFQEAVEMVSRRLKVQRGEAESRLRTADGIRTTPDPKLAAALEFSRVSPLRKIPSVEPGSALDLLGQAAAQASRDATLAKHPLVNRADLLNWLDQQAPEKAVLTMAPVSIIEDVITAVYDEADKGGDRPNINQLPKAVLPRLKARGYTSTGRRIKEIGSAEKFASRRGEIGKRRT